ncbi:hypothetical protein V5799_012818 [Amblyomma americanum]|uniref:Uncharacterized protein n=1 Tax=Amblyomma americanum TaxID=6943 RepID=A0AAQ4E7K6_AMBAM
MTESSNDVPETSPGESLPSIHSETVPSSPPGVEHSASEPTAEGGTTMYPNVDGSVANSIATGFEKESDKLNELDADQSVKEVGSVVPESSAAATEVPAVKLPNDTTATAPIQAASEADATTPVEHNLAESSAVPTTTEESVASTGEAAPTSSHVSDDATTSPPSLFPLTTASATSSELTTGSYNDGVNTEPSVSSETTPVPYRPETEPSYGPFSTEQSPPYVAVPPEVPVESSSAFGESVPQTGEPFIDTYSEPAHGSDSSPQGETTPAGAYSHEATTGSFHGPTTYPENLGATIPSYLYSTGVNTDSYPVFGTGYGNTHDAAAAEGPTTEHIQQEPVASTTQSSEGASSQQGHAYDATGTPVQHSAQPEEQATTTSTPLSSADAGDVNEGTIPAETIPTTSYPYPVDATPAPTQSPSEAGSTPPTQHDGTTEHHAFPDAGHVEDQTEPASSTAAQQHEETTTSADSMLSTTLHESAAGVTTTESTVTEQSTSNSSKMGRALGETDATTTNAIEPSKEPTSTTPADTVTAYTPPSATDEAPQAQSTAPPSSESIHSTTSESTPSVVSGGELTTVAPESSTATSNDVQATTTTSNDVQAATTTSDIVQAVTTEVTHTVSADTAVSHTTTSPDVALTSAESVTEAATTGAPSTPVLSAFSQASATELPATTSSPTAALDEGTTPGVSDTTAQETKDDTTTVSAGEQSTSLITETTTERVSGSPTSPPIDVFTQSATQSPEKSTDISSELPVTHGSESTTQSPDIASEVQTGTEQVSTGTATTTSLPGEAEATPSSESGPTHDLTAATPALTQEPTTEVTLQSHTEPDTQSVSGSTERVGDVETTSGGASSVEPTAPILTEEPPVSATEEVTATPPSPQTTEAPTHETTTATSPGFWHTVEGQTETTVASGETTTPGKATAEPPTTVVTVEPAAGDTTTSAVGETAAPAEGETTMSVTEGTTPPASSRTTTATYESTTADEVQTTTSAPDETTPMRDGAVTTTVVETTTQAVSAATTLLVGDATTPSMEETTEKPTVGVTESGTSGASSSASRSPKILTHTTLPPTLELTTEPPTTKQDTMHSFTTASDLFSTTRLYTLRRQTTPPASSEEPTTEQATSEDLQWTEGVTTSPEVQEWSSTTHRPVFTAGSTTGPETGSTVDASCNIVEGSLPVACLLPEELNHTVTVKFADLNRTRAETFRTEARVWLLDYCSKNGIPLGDPTVVFLNGEDRGMDLISFFVVNRTRGSVVPSETVVAVLNSMKLTFEDKLGTAITDVFYGLPVLQKKDVGVAGFLGSSLGLVYVIVGAALAALLLLALLVVIMVKCRTLSSHQYSPDAEKLTKDSHMRAEMGDLRPADEILKEEAQLKEGLNGNGTHINGDSWVVPYAQIVSERKSTTDAQDTRL